METVPAFKVNPAKFSEAVAEVSAVKFWGLNTIRYWPALAPAITEAEFKVCLPLVPFKFKLALPLSKPVIKLPLASLAVTFKVNDVPSVIVEAEKGLVTLEVKALAVGAALTVNAAAGTAAAPLYETLYTTDWSAAAGATVGTVKVTTFPVESRVTLLGVTSEAPPVMPVWVTAKSLRAGAAVNALPNVTVIVPLTALTDNKGKPYDS